MRNTLLSMMFAVVTVFATTISVRDCRAGPPYISDDPEPTDTGRWEIYDFVQGANIGGLTSGSGGLDINYGGFPNIQLTAVVPVDFETGRQGAAGPGDLELAVKYRFLHQKEGTMLPDVALFPRLFVPTASGRFGTGQAGLLLPLWAQKDIDGWSIFGGGGYTINPGVGQRNFWLGGIAVSRAVTERLSLGVEVDHQTSTEVDAKPIAGIDIGATYGLTEHWSLLASGQPGIEGARYEFYLALEAVY